MLSSVEDEKSYLTLQPDVAKLPSLYVMPRHTNKPSISFLTEGRNVIFDIINFRRRGGGGGGKGVRALRGYFCPLWSQNLKVDFHQFLLIGLLEE